MPHSLTASQRKIAIDKLVVANIEESGPPSYTGKPETYYLDFYREMTDTELQDAYYDVFEENIQDINEIY